MLGSPQSLLPRGEFRSRQLAWPQNIGRSARHGSRHLFWAAVACVALTCNPGWLLLRHPLFYSVSSLSPGHSLVCLRGWECCLVIRLLTGTWTSPPDCVNLSLSLSRSPQAILSLGILECAKEAQIEPFSGTPHISASTYHLHSLPSPEDLSGLQGKPSSSGAPLLYSWWFSQPFCDCLEPSLWGLLKHKSLKETSFFSALHSVTAILGTCDLDGWGEIIHKRGNVEEKKNVQPL